MDILSAISTQAIKEGGSVFNPRSMEARPQKASAPKEDPAAAEEPAADPTQEALQIEREKIERMAETMDKYLDAVQRDLKISVHEKTGNIMVKVISKADGKVIREIPPEAMLDLAAKMEEMIGALFNESV